MSLTEDLTAHMQGVLGDVDPALAEQFERQASVRYAPHDLSDHRVFFPCRYGGFIEEDGGMYDELPVPCRPEVA